MSPTSGWAAGVAVVSVPLIKIASMLDVMSASRGWRLRRGAQPPASPPAAQSDFYVDPRTPAAAQVQQWEAARCVTYGATVAGRLALAPTTSAGV